MASTFEINTGRVIPENKGGPRVCIGCRVLAQRDSVGALIVQVRRGDGSISPENYDVVVRTKMFAAAAGVEILLQLGTMDLGLADFDDRSYQMTVLADGGATLIVRQGLIATEPFTAAGTGP